MLTNWQPPGVTLLTNMFRIQKIKFYNQLDWEIHPKNIYLEEDRTILSHHRLYLPDGWINIHGHSHTKGILKDNTHICISVENINYTPVDLDELIRSFR